MNDNTSMLALFIFMYMIFAALCTEYSYTRYKGRNVDTGTRFVTFLLIGWAIIPLIIISIPIRVYRYYVRGCQPYSSF